MKRNCYSQTELNWIEVLTNWMKCCGDSQTGHHNDLITSHENAYVNNSPHKRVGDVCEVSLSLSCHDASNDMQHDLPRSWPNFQTDLSGTICICLDASRCEEYDVVSRYSLSSLVQKLLAKTLFLIKSSMFSLTWSEKVKIWLKMVKSGTAGCRTSQTSFRLCCEALLQLGGKWAWGASIQVRCGMAK